jgi:hypothetical protein
LLYNKQTAALKQFEIATFNPYLHGAISGCYLGGHFYFQRLLTVTILNLLVSWLS